MKTYNKTYSLETGEQIRQLSISNLCVDYADFEAGNPYNTTFDVRVVSENFAGLANFEYNIKDFLDFIKSLNDLYNFKIDTAELNKDLSYGSKVKFKMNETGHVTVSGELHGGNMGEQVLQFEFTTDQTAIKSFCSELSKDLGE